MTVPFVELQQLRKSFGDHHVVDGVDLRIDEGERVAILGPSGTGKSVLLKLISGLIEVDEGDVRLWGRSIASFTSKDWNKIRQRMGLVFQTGALFDSMTVFDNVAYPMVEAGRPAAEIAERVEKLLDLVELPNTGHLAPSDLSGGMQKRVALARTLSLRPDLILYDEPTAGLDPVRARLISQLIRRASDRFGTTAVVVTHDIECARIVANRWVLVSNGRVLADDEPLALFRSQREDVREFLEPWILLIGEERVATITAGGGQSMNEEKA